MYDIDKLKKANNYIDMLLQGVNSSANTTVDSENINYADKVDCLKYISFILNDQIDAIVNKNEEKICFFITPDQCNLLIPSEYTMKISEISNEINRVTKINNSKKLTAVNINDWLENIGMLEKGENGSRLATEDGNLIGIESRLATADDGHQYYANSYNTEAQKFIYDNITTIAEWLEVSGKSKHSSSEYKRKYNLAGLPSGTSIEQYIKDNKEACFIISIGSIDTLSHTGTYKSLLLYKGHKKIFEEKGIEAESTNKVVFKGLKTAAAALKSPVDVVVLVQKRLGFGKSYNPEFKSCNELISILTEIGCKVTVCECSYRKNEIDEIFF